MNDAPVYNVTVRKTVELPADQLADVFATAFEGGSLHWIERIDVPDFHGHNLASEVLAHGHTIVVYSDEGDVYTVGRAEVERGLGILSDKYPRFAGAIVDGSYDADDADALVQIICMEDIVYG